MARITLCREVNVSLLLVFNKTFLVHSRQLSHDIFRRYVSLDIVVLVEREALCVLTGSNRAAYVLSQEAFSVLPDLISKVHQIKISIVLVAVHIL